MMLMMDNFKFEAFYFVEKLALVVIEFGANRWSRVSFNIHADKWVNSHKINRTYQ